MKIDCRKVTEEWKEKQKTDKGRMVMEKLGGGAGSRDAITSQQGTIHERIDQSITHSHEARSEGPEHTHALTVHVHK